MQDNELLRLSADIVSAHVTHNKVSEDMLPQLILAVYAALGEAGAADAEVVAQTPAVPIKKSIFPAYIVCLEDGKKMKLLKPYLLRSYGMTPDQYRAKWGLPNSYPMTAPDYAARRSVLAKQAGLGRISVAAEPVEVLTAPLDAEMPEVPEVPVQKFPAKTRGRKPGSKTAKPADVEVVAE